MTTVVHVALLLQAVPCECSPGASPHKAAHYCAWYASDGRRMTRVACDTSIATVLREAYAEGAKGESRG